MHAPGKTHAATDAASRTARLRAWSLDVLRGGLNPQSSDARLVRQVQVLNGLMLTGMLLCIPLGIFWSMFENPLFAHVYGAAMSAWAVLFYWLRRHQQLQIVGRAAVCVLFGICTATVLLMDSVKTSLLAWYMLMPLAAAVCIGRRDLWFWGVVAMLAPLVLTVAPVHDQLGSTSLTSLIEDPKSLVVLALGAFITSVLTSIWISHHEQLAQRLDDSVVRLEKEAAAHRLLVDTAMMASAEAELASGARALLQPLADLDWVSSVAFWDTREDMAPERPVCQFPLHTAFPRSSALQKVLRTGERGTLDDPATETQRYFYPIRDGLDAVGAIELLPTGSARQMQDGDWLVRQIAIQLGHIAERERTAATILREARFDALTGLHNRRAFQELIGAEIALAQRNESKLALLFIDLNDFKRVNDSLGHAAGDQVLQLVATRLQHAIRARGDCAEGPRSADGIARVGGDEFTLLLTQINDEKDAEAVAQRILAALSTPIQLGERQFKVGASIGIALYPQDAQHADALVRCADAAMYSAKRRDMSGYCRYQASQRAVDSLSFEAEMRHALAAGQLAMYYQPVFTCQTSELVGAEALIRWRHPERGWISPAQFIPLAEEIGLINEISRFQFDTALRWFSDVRHLTPANFRLALNMSPAQIDNEAFTAWLIERIDRSGLPTHQIELELTETALLADTAVTRANLASLSDLGLCIALDDFGTGQSSLSPLKRFPIGRIKIDRSFVSGLPNRSEDVAIVEAVLSLAQSLKIPAVAEGVENEAQRLFLTNRRCQEMQGFLLAKPMPADQLLEVLTESTHMGNASNAAVG